jgi:hypothetical protein
MPFWVILAALFGDIARDLSRQGRYNAQQRSRVLIISTAKCVVE